MTRPFIQTLNAIHKELWNKSSNGEITKEEIMKTVKKEAGYTVKEKYWDELHDFERIESVPDTDTWIVKKPEKAGIETDKTGDKKVKQVMIPEDVVKAGEQYGVNFSALATEAVIEEVSTLKQFATDYLGDQYSEEEAEFMFEMIKKELYNKRGDRQQMARRQRRRRQLYEQIFEEEADNERIEDLRKKSFELHEMLEI